jgi:hypothetical protein
MPRLGKVACATAALMAVIAVTAANAQPPVARPQPPPPPPSSAKPPATPAKPGTTPPPATTSKPGSATSPVAQPVGERRAVSADTQAMDTPPDASQLNAPVLAGAQYLASYDAGQGQRFYLYGSVQRFADVVTYYRTVLKDRGELVFDEPAMHMFEVGRFRETDVAFPPGVTVKDYTWGGSPGYMNPKRGAEPAFFPTVIQIVPPPPGLAVRRD